MKRWRAMQRGRGPIGLHLHENNNHKLCDSNLKLLQHDHTLVIEEAPPKKLGIVRPSWKDDDEWEQNGVPFEQNHCTHGVHRPTAHLKN